MPRGGGRQLLVFEGADLAPIKVEVGTALEDAGLPTHLRATVALPDDAEPAQFVQMQVPAALDNSDATRAYIAPDDADAKYTAGETVVYTVGGAEDAYRVYGEVPQSITQATNSAGNSSENALATFSSEESSTDDPDTISSQAIAPTAEYAGEGAWYACNEHGTIFGVVEDVPVSWVCDTYDANTPGTYIAMACLTSNYIFGGTLPSAEVEVVASEEAAAALEYEGDEDEESTSTNSIDPGGYREGSSGSGTYIDIGADGKEHYVDGRSPDYINTQLGRDYDTSDCSGQLMLYLEMHYEYAVRDGIVAVAMPHPDANEAEMERLGYAETQTSVGLPCSTRYKTEIETSVVTHENTDATADPSFQNHLYYTTDTAGIDLNAKEVTKEDLAAKVTNTPRGQVHWHEISLDGTPDQEPRKLDMSEVGNDQITCLIFQFGLQKPGVPVFEVWMTPIDEQTLERSWWPIDPIIWAYITNQPFKDLDGTPSATSRIHVGGDTDCNVLYGNVFEDENHDGLWDLGEHWFDGRRMNVSLGIYREDDGHPGEYSPLLDVEGRPVELQYSDNDFHEFIIKTTIGEGTYEAEYLVQASFHGSYLYEFRGLPRGNYQVRLVGVPESYKVSPQMSFTDEGPERNCGVGIGSKNALDYVYASFSSEGKDGASAPPLDVGDGFGDFAYEDLPIHYSVCDIGLYKDEEPPEQPIVRKTPDEYILDERGKLGPPNWVGWTLKVKNKSSTAPIHDVLIMDTLPSEWDGKGTWVPRYGMLDIPILPGATQYVLPSYWTSVSEPEWASGDGFPDDPNDPYHDSLGDNLDPSKWHLYYSTSRAATNTRARDYTKADLDRGWADTKNGRVEWKECTLEAMRAAGKPSPEGNYYNLNDEQLQIYAVILLVDEIPADGGVTFRVGMGPHAMSDEEDDSWTGVAGFAPDAGRSWSPGTVLANTISCRDSYETTSVQVPNREISGCVWNDANKDGVHDPNEELFKSDDGIEVNLLHLASDGTWQPVRGQSVMASTPVMKDVRCGTGSLIEGTNLYRVARDCTSELDIKEDGGFLVAASGWEGGYSFIGLPPGTYAVQFEDEAIQDFIVSPKDVGGNTPESDKVDSDAVGTYSGDAVPCPGGQHGKPHKLEHADIQGIELPDLADMQGAAFVSEHQDLGLSAKSASVTVVKKGHDGQPLEGVKFQLEFCMRNIHHTPEHCDWVSADPNHDPAQGSSSAFAPDYNPWILTTDANGKVTFSGLEGRWGLGTTSGLARLKGVQEYRLIEVAAPEGYQILPEPIYFTLPYGDVNGTATGNPAYSIDGVNYYLDITFTVQDPQMFEMPVSGLLGPTPRTTATVGGSVLAVSAALVTAYRQRIRNRRLALAHKAAGAGAGVGGAGSGTGRTRRRPWGLRNCARREGGWGT